MTLKLHGIEKAMYPSSSVLATAFFFSVLFLPTCILGSIFVSTLLTSLSFSADWFDLFLSFVSLSSSSSIPRIFFLIQDIIFLGVSLLNVKDKFCDIP